VPIAEVYGMTETTGLACSLLREDVPHRIGTAGKAALFTEMKIMKSDTEEAAAGEQGEIWMRGANVTTAYWRRPEADAEAFVDGWLRSGDIGRLDKDGYLFIVDRIKEMIISGGLNVYPTEVEEVLYTHPAVEECAVVGMPHKEYGEAVSALVKRKQGVECSDVDLIDYCKKQMASYKSPKKILFVEEFPKSPAGKILKREIRSSFF
jgi:acyl-CoA synthetase (AMP-forming)/AMP-acid ligase II